MTARNNAGLPAGFDDLQEFVGDWALGTERERAMHRFDAEMVDIQHFYDTMVPRFDDVLAYLSPRWRAGDLHGFREPEDETLYLLLCSVAEVSNSVERVGAPDDPNVFAKERMLILSPA